MRMDVRNLKTLLRNPRAAINAARLVVMLQGDAWRAGRRFSRDLTLEQRRSFALGVLAGTGVEVTFAVDGTTWTCDAVEGEICRELLLTGGYQIQDVQDVIAWVQAHRPGRTAIVDVGANIGTTSIPFARAGYDVLAIEAVPSTYEMLVANVERNGLGDRVRCVNVAVSEHATVTMNLTGSSGVSEVAGTGNPGFESQGYRTIDMVSVPGAAMPQLVERQFETE